MANEACTRLIKKRDGGFSGIVKVIARPKLAVVASACIAAILIVSIMGVGNLLVLQKELFPEQSVPGPVTVPSVSEAPIASEQPVTQSSSSDVPQTEATDSSQANQEVMLPSESSPPPMMEFTDDTFDVLSSDPDKYAGSTATISGKVYDALDQSSNSYIIVTFKILSQAIDSDESRAVIMYQEVKRTKTVNPDIEVDDCIAIEGKVRSGISETNSLGQSIRIPLIDASSIADIECIDSAFPSESTIELGVQQSFGGITLAADRVQLAEDHIRIKITAENTGAGDSVFIREKGSFLVYGDGEFQNISHLTAFMNYRINSEIVSGYPTTGYLFFEPIEEYDAGPLIFKIMVEKVEISGNTKSTFIFTI
ncbi:MAG: hypothetical protein MN733_05845 [Nitrososphaera sp.]|nr:hypothetical protein [Nitrososphaera sp.]